MKKSGFTLIELSVVLALIGVILYGSMAILVTGVQTSQVNSTVATMDAIEKALLNFRVAFGRIPCPADITLTASSANYGVEAANTGTCTGGSPAANFIAASGTAEGGVPTRALLLPDSYMYDGWGHKFRYAANPNYTVTTSTTCTLSTSPTITINDASGAARSTKAIYAIISHGANGHGAYTSNGVVINAGSTNADEQTNCHCDNTGAHTGGAGVLSPVTYVQKAPTEATAGSPLTAFDDIVAYKEFWQLMTPNLSTNSLGCLFSGYYRTVTLDHTKVGTVGNTDQSSFPVLLSGTYSYLATTANGGMVTNANGYDITFTSDSAGTHLLPFERESWNATTGASVFWVQVPTVSHSADTVIYLQYGNPNVTTDQSNASGTWDSHYKGVYHLNDNASTTTVNDSTTLNPGTSAANTNTKTTAGKIGNGLNFNGSSDFVSTAAAPVTTAANWTLSAWVKSAAEPQTYGIMIYNGDDVTGGFGFAAGTWTSTSTVGVIYGRVSWSDSGYTLTSGTWTHITLANSGSSSTLYINGTSTYTIASNPNTPANYFAIGREPNYAGSFFNGAIDEARISNTARSADWIKTEYNNQNSPDKATYGASGFYTVGAQTSR